MPDIAGDLSVAYLSPTRSWDTDTEAYRSAGMQAFQFFRRSSDSRYSSHSMMGLTTIQDALNLGDAPDTLPSMSVASTPYRYDEETEVKFGGIVGLLLTWQNGKSMLAVHPDRREQGIGQKLLATMVRYHRPVPYFWLARTNTQAQRFMLKYDFVPSAFNSAGAIRYASTREQQSDSGDNEAY